MPPSHQQRQPRLENHAAFASITALRWIMAASLLTCLALYVAWTWHWPLVGDSSLIHYICFLMNHGMAPYRDVPDMNLPGSFLIERLVMHVYGGGSLASRLYDLTVLGAAAAAMLAITWPYDRLAGLFAAVLFALVHGRDGINNTGQRDLTMAALVALAYAFLFLLFRQNSATAAFLFGFCISAAGTIKPTALLLGMLLIILLPVALPAVLRRQGRPTAPSSLWAIAGFLTPLAIVLAFLIQQHAVHAFAHTMLTVVPYFASLGRKPWPWLALHSISPLLPLVVVWAIVIGARMLAEQRWKAWRQKWSRAMWERTALSLGAAVMLAGFLVQGKGFPYHRYPFLILLLLLIGLDLTWALRKRGVWLALGAVGLAYGSLVLAPQSVAAIRRYEWRNQQFVTMLQTDLENLGGLTPSTQLSGHIQCIDTISGCATVLYRMKLIQATGMLSDFLIFGPEQNQAVRENQADFLRAVSATPPKVIIVSSNLFPSGPRDFKKLDQWPAFKNLLETRYKLYAQRTPPGLVRWWSRPEQSASYRIYLLKLGT